MILVLFMIYGTFSSGIIKKSSINIIYSYPFLLCRPTRVPEGCIFPAGFVNNGPGLSPGPTRGSPTGGSWGDGYKDGEEFRPILSNFLW